MNSFAATDAKNSFGRLLTQVQRSPVEITKQGKGIAVLLSMEAYQEIQERLNKREPTNFSWLEDWRKSTSPTPDQEPISKESYRGHLDEKYG
ncbi:MAG: type II toxin-antitoxin system Phd/YefM family antitoxin [Roseibacillus sp.]